ncbi:MAG: tetratricopeptide repeat protein [Methanotrichaceae archaeon]|nr:tetratricopeptide repeat protein [Methanotrichaceae archaeon]
MKSKSYYILTAFCILITLAFGQDEDNDIRSLMQNGRDAFNKSLYDAAISYFDKVIEKDPTNAEAWYRKGLAIADPREFDWTNQENLKALENFKKALELNPLYKEALALNSWKLALTGNPEEGLKNANKALEINSTSDIAWNAKGICLYLIGDLDGALPCFDMAMKYNPNWGDPVANKGTILEDQGHRDAGNEYTKKAENLTVRAF